MGDQTGQTILQVLRRGVSLPASPWEGQVRSVFSRAVNLMSAEGQLVSLVIDELQMTDFALLVERIPPLSAGMRVSGSTGQLRIAPAQETRLSPALTVDLSSAVPWSGTIPADMCAAFPAEITAPLRRALTESGKSEGLLGLASGEANLLVRRADRVLAHARQRGRKRGSIDLSELIGLGIGFTPSGDDFIIGACAAEEAIEPAVGEEVRAPVIDRAAISRRTEATTYGSAALLRSAARGSYSALIIELLRVLFGDPAAAETGEAGESIRRRCSRAVQLAERYGETSGIDSLVGIWWYLSISASGGGSGQC
jgi:hypothetical protein